MRERRTIEITQSKIRSAVANGTRLLDGLDGRSGAARRFRDISHAIAQDLGGINHLSQAELQLVRSAAGLTVMREKLDAIALNGDEIDSADYVRIVNGLRRTLTTLGLKRVPREVTPDLQSYLRNRNGNGRVIDHNDGDEAD